MADAIISRRGSGIFLSELTATPADVLAGRKFLGSGDVDIQIGTADLSMAVASGSGTFPSEKIYLNPNNNNYHIVVEVNGLAFAPKVVVCWKSGDYSYTYVSSIYESSGYYTIFGDSGFKMVLPYISSSPFSSEMNWRAWGPALS